MLPARISSSSGGGDYGWLKGLIGKVKSRTDELQKLAKRIRLSPDPAGTDVATAQDLVGQLLNLISEELAPHRARLSKFALESGAAPNLNREIAALEMACEAALIAISTYGKTLGNEEEQQRKGRSNRRFSGDQDSLQQRRIDAATKMSEFIAVSDDFFHIFLES